jgi:hypothetical protein
MPSAFAAFMLMISSNLVGCSTGRSAGFAPSNILSMVYSAARRGCPCPRCRHDVEIPNQPAARAGLSWGTNARNLDRRRVETAVELARQDRFLGGSESFFVAPCCGTLRRILYLLDGCSRGEPTRLVCRGCSRLEYRSRYGSGGHRPCVGPSSFGAAMVGTRCRSGGCRRAHAAVAPTFMRAGFPSCSLARLRQRPRSVLCLKLSSDGRRDSIVPRARGPRQQPEQPVDGVDAGPVDVGEAMFQARLSGESLRLIAQRFGVSLEEAERAVFDP